MPALELLLSFLAATAVFAYMPGPAMLYTAAQTVARGRRAGWMAALGIHIGGYVHVIAAMLGISALFAAVPTLYVVVKLAGAGYLIWLGLQVFRSTGDYTQITANATSTKASGQSFQQSVAVEVLNPKTAIFYIAFLPQFTDPAASIPLWGQLLLLGTIVNVMFSSADVLCVLLSSSIVDFFNRTGNSTRILQRIGGVILVGLGVNLALTQQ